MIAKIKLPQQNDGSFYSTLIECDRIGFTETENMWHAQLIKNDKEVAEFKVNVNNSAEYGTMIYVMEGGKTVDKLPRR